MHLADGTPTNGLPYDRAGSDIDTTNPEAARWYWNVIRDNYVAKGFDAFWADETEPDLPPNGATSTSVPARSSSTSIRSSTPPRSTTASARTSLNTRALILARDAYLGAQHNGAIFWSSDIYPNWDTLKRQVPTGINFVASGMPYWSTDIGGWQYLPGNAQTGAPAADRPQRRARRGAAATTTTRSSTFAGSSTAPFSPTSAATAAVRRTRSGRTASRPSRSWKSICACATH